MIPSNVNDSLTAIAAASAALSLIFSAYQYFRQRHDQKVASTLEYCRRLALVYRKPHVSKFMRELGRLRDLDQEAQSDVIGKLLHDNRDSELVADFSSFVDELEYFAVLTRTRSIYTKLALAESGEWIAACYGDMKPLIRFQLKQPSTMYLNFVWLAEQANKKIAQKAWRKRYMWKPKI
jgi:hypothetical protein